MARKKIKQTFRYTCPITEEEFKLTRQSKNPDDLMSIAAYYDMNPEEDDRPPEVKTELGITDNS